MTFCRAVSARTGMVTMAVRQAAAKAKPIEVLRIMTITCDEGPRQTPEKAFPFRTASHKIKGKSLAGMAEFADDRRRQGVPRGQICSTIMQPTFPSSGRVTLKFCCQEKARGR